MAEPKIMTKPLPLILDEMDDNIRAAAEAARRAEEAARIAREAAGAATKASVEAEKRVEEARMAGEEAAEQASRAAIEAVAEAGQAAKAAEEKAAAAVKHMEEAEKRFTDLYSKVMVSFAHLLALLKTVANVYIAMGDGCNIWAKQLKDKCEDVERKVFTSS